MRYWLGLIIGLAALWLLLSGMYTPLMLGFGVVSCAFTAFICHRLRLIGAETVPLELMPRLPGYFAWLTLEIAKSNADVIWRIVWPGRHISPTMITLTAHQRTSLGQVLFANSITLTPGTVTVGLRGNHAEVHALTHCGSQDLEGGGMDQRVRRVEGRSRPVRTPNDENER